MRAALIATFLAAFTVASLPAAAREPVSAADYRAAADAPPATAAQVIATRDPPLIAYALELSHADSRAHEKALYVATTNLRALTFEMSRNPPPSDEDCAHTLGASRFADQYARLGVINDQLGNFEAVIDANESALACEPRVASYHASIASAKLTLGHLDEARAAAERGHAIDPEDEDVQDVRARLDFMQERWADAIARFRLQVLDEHYGDYARCYLWLAQRRAGVREPELPNPKQDEKQPEPPLRKQWPAPILDTLRGELSEEGLVTAIRDAGHTDGEAREWLSEALFYVGELRLAEGDAETARRHFASVVNLRVLNFVEYGMARAELRKMRASGRD